MTGPVSLRRLSQVGAQLADKVRPRGSIANHSGGAVGPMSRLPSRGLKVTAGPPILNEDGTYKTGGHVAIVAEPGDHHWAEDRSMTFGHHAESNVPLETIPDKAMRLPDGRSMPPGSMNIYPGSGMVMEHSLSDDGDTVSIKLGPLSPKQVVSFAEFVDESYRGQPINYQRAGIDAPNCVTMVAKALTHVFGIDPKKVAGKPLELPVEYAARVAPDVIAHVAEERRKHT
jgi:hypothetical protein